jgi:hypothetical protein
MRFHRIGAFLLTLTSTVTASAGIGGNISGYTTLSRSATTLNSTANVTFVQTTIICNSGCVYRLSGGHQILWSATGDVVGSWPFSTTSYTYRSIRAASGIQGQCFHATSSGKYEITAGSINGISIPATPWTLDQGGPWTSSSVCIPSPPPPPPPLPPLEVCDHCEPGGMEPLIFDLDGNGVADQTAWTAPGEEDAFLYVDWNHNHIVDGGQELFGDASVMPSGAKARNGYEALTAYDDPANGGDNNGIITSADAIWGRLRLWVDRNHDGLLSNDENASLGSAGVVEIPLVFTVMGETENYGADSHGNQHYLQGEYTRRERGRTRRLAIHDIYFVVDTY